MSSPHLTKSQSESQSINKPQKGLLKGLGISIKDLKESVGFTKNSSVLSKTIRFLRTQQVGSQSQKLQNMDRINQSLENQRRKIKSNQNKLKQSLHDKEEASKEISATLNMRQEEMSLVKLKRLEEKLKQHEERVFKLKKDTENNKRTHITDLFRQIKEDKNDHIPIPTQLVDRSHDNPDAESRGVFTLTEDLQDRRRRENKKAKKDQTTNPFDQYGTKEMWDKIVDLAKNNQAIKFPEIGIEKTPIYHLQQAQGEQSINKKNDFYTRLIKGDFIYKGKVNKLNFENMYEEIAYLKSYKPRIEKIDPINKNLLSHKLAKAMEQAGVLWGQKGKRYRIHSLQSLNSYEKSMEQFLDETKPVPEAPLQMSRQQAQSQQNLNKGRQQHMFTKQHRKILLG